MLELATVGELLPSVEFHVFNSFGSRVQVQGPVSEGRSKKEGTPVSQHQPVTSTSTPSLGGINSEIKKSIASPTEEK